MKFAHEFKEALVKEGFPRHWVESAIPYGQLKKCIKKVESELKALGLDSATLAQLMPETTNHSETQLQNGVAFQYDFKGDYDELFFPYNLLLTSGAGEKVLRPKLTLFIRLEDGLAVDATLSTDTREFLKLLARGRTKKDNASEILHAISEEKDQQTRPDSPKE